jgi:hypothetical protein
MLEKQFYKQLEEKAEKAGDNNEQTHIQRNTPNTKNLKSVASYNMCALQLDAYAFCLPFDFGFSIQININEFLLKLQRV